MRGRGATSCLICNDDQKTCIFNNISIIYGIRMLFDTHKVRIHWNFIISLNHFLLFTIKSNFILSLQYNIMLMSSKICIKCAGRLHQLFDFNLIKTSFDIQRNASAEGEGNAQNLEEFNCEFCNSDSDIMHEDLVSEVKEAAANTKWARVSCQLLVDIFYWTFTFRITAVIEVFTVATLATTTSCYTRKLNLSWIKSASTFTQT